MRRTARPVTALLLAALLAACQPSSTASPSGTPSPSGAESISPSDATGPSADPSSSAEASPAAAPTAAPSATPAPPPASVNCSSGSLSANLFATLRASAPSTSFGQGACVVWWTLFMTGEGAGTATVRAGGTPVLSIDIGNFPNIGTEGAGSGERDVAVSPPLALAAGTVLSLDLSGCSSCSSLLVTVAAASR